MLYRMRPLPDNDGALDAGAGSFPDWYEGGWQELLPNGDLACEHDGVWHEHAGEVWRRAWDWHADERAAELEVRLRTLPLRLSKRFELDEGRPLLRIRELLENESDRPIAVVWGQHPAFGPPLLAPGARLDLPPCRVEAVHLDTTTQLEPGLDYQWPVVPTRDGGTADLSRIGAPEDRNHELCLLHDLSAGWYALRNDALDLGFALRFDERLFHRLWLWLDYGGGDEDPWRGLYAIAVEPMTGVRSLNDSVARKAVLTIPPRARVKATFEASTFAPRGPVVDVRLGGVVASA